MLIENTASKIKSRSTRRCILIDGKRMNGNARMAKRRSGHSRQTPQTGENHSRFTDFRKPNGSRILSRSFLAQKLKNFKIQKIFIYSIAHRKNSAKPTEKKEKF